MKIEKLNIPSDESVGLKHLKAERLEDIVMLTGRNGGGKTRILRKIIDTYNEMPEDKYKKDLEKNRSLFQNNFVQAQKKMEEANKKWENKENNISGIKRAELTNSKKECQKDLNNSRNIVNMLDWSKLVINVEKTQDNRNHFVEYVPKKMTMSDPRNSRAIQLICFNPLKTGLLSS